MTTDYRDVLGELVLRRLGNGRLGEVFPGFVPVMRGLPSNE
ncbi:MAG: hypothetical protein U0232_17735 [Thermomicrobiales bacterium]